MLKPFRRTSFALALLSLALCVSAWQSQAQIVLSNRNSVAKINPGTQDGMFYWDIQGQNQLQKQWFWFSIGNNAPLSINAISAPSVTLGVGSLTGRYVDITYSTAAFNLSVEYLLTGGSIVGPGQVGSADISETITVNNTSGSALPFHLYQFSNFNLSGTPNNDSVILSTDSSGNYNSAKQTDGINVLTESVSVVAPSATHGEAATVPQTLSELNNGTNSVTLNDNSTAGPGNVTWALEWDTLIDTNNSFVLSKDKHLTVLVPEPSALILLPCAFGAFGFYRARRSARF